MEVIEFFSVEVFGAGVIAGACSYAVFFLVSYGINKFFQSI